MEEEKEHEPTQTCVAAAVQLEMSPMIEAAAAAVASHESRQEAAAKNQSIYQSQWQAQVNNAVTDETFQVNQLVLQQVHSNRQHKALARSIPKQIVLVVEAHRYSKYKILTQNGLLRDTIHANMLTQVPVDTIRPSIFPIDQLGIDQLLDQYSDHTPKKQRKTPLLIDQWIRRYLIPNGHYICQSALVKKDKLYITRKFVNKF